MALRDKIVRFLIGFWRNNRGAHRAYAEFINDNFVECSRVASVNIAYDQGRPEVCRIMKPGWYIHLVAQMNLNDRCDQGVR